MTLTQRELAAFLCIARTGSVGNAASSLSLTQPAVSRTLRRLEMQLGVSLFVRHATGMQLTAFGKTLLPHAELMEAEALRAVEEIRLLKGASRGLARIGIVPSVAVDLLPRAISAALVQSPGIQIQVVEGPGDQLADALGRGQIDFAVAAMEREPIDSNVVATPLMEDEVCVVARAGHAIFGKAPLKIADLAAESWALPERGNVIWTEFRMMFRREGSEIPEVAVAANSVHTLKCILLSTDILTMMARASFSLEERHGLLAAVPFAAGHWRRRLGIFRRVGSQLMPAANLLLTEMARAVRGGV